WRASTPLREGVRRYLAWLAPERAPAPEPAPAAAPVPVRTAVPVAQRTPVVTTAQLPAWPSTPTASWPSAPIVALACGAGTLIPWLLAWKTDDFGTGQSGYVAITCLIAILCALCLLPLGPGGRPARGWVFAGWLVAGWAVLDAIPGSRDVLNLGVP